MNFTQVGAIDRYGVGLYIARFVNVGFETNGIDGQLDVAVQRVDAEVVAYSVAVDNI